MQSDVQSSVTTTSRDGGSVRLTDDAALVAALRKIVGKSHVITEAERAGFAPAFVLDMVRRSRLSAPAVSSSSGGG